MVTILLQKILDLLKEKLGDIGNFIASFFISDPQDGQALIYDAESEKWVNDYIEPAIKDTASGEVATFNTDVALPLIDAKFGIVASQESGTPTPSSPKAITGYTGINVKHSGADTSDYTTYPVSWQTEAGTVYGGVVDVTTGKLTVTHTRIDLGSLSWGTGSGGAARFVATPNPIAKGSSTIICEVLQTSTNTAIYAGSVDKAIAVHTNGTIWVRDTDYTDKDDFKTAMDGKYAVYELATPIEYDLTPVEITALVGTNNIWGDTNGNAEVEYYTGAAKDIINVANIVYDLTSDLVIDYETIEESSCNVKAYRQGHMVIVEINYMKYLTTPTDTAVIISGLPKAKETTTSFVYDIYNGQVGGRMRVNTDGELTQWYFRPYPDHDICGQIIYITDEV